jgi:hypothetical protein
MDKTKQALKRYILRYAFKAISSTKLFKQIFQGELHELAHRLEQA